MKTRLILLLLALGTGVAHGAEWRVVLLKPPGCTSCIFVEELLKRRSQLREAVLEDGSGGQVTAKIERRASSELAAQEWSELAALPWFDAKAWRRQADARSAQVLLKRDGVVVSGGDIADSADLRTARLPETVTTPNPGDDVQAAREARTSFASELYLRSWNLNWFYRIALDPSLPRSRRGAGPLLANAKPLDAPLGPTNVMLMSTASGAADNEIFNALRIEEIRDVLAQSLAFDTRQLHIFYGSGNPQGANALEVRNGRLELVHRNVEGAQSFTPEAAARIFQSIRSRPGSRNLLVLVGHGGPEGAGMWGSPLPLSPAALRELHEHGGGDDVLVSGNCFGGVMARATSCGFFGARPDIIATGCQADAVEVAQSRDYLHMFFAGLSPGARRLVDADGDGAVSFAEAHWYASTEGDVRNITYTSIDALADAWFDAHDSSAPHSVSVKDILLLADAGTPAEARTLRNLLTGYDPALQVSLDDLAAQSTTWKPGAGPRPLVAQLARRLLFKRNAQEERQELARLQACENRTVADFLRP
ncbi:MAG TPA: hypothetical protein VKO83_11235 [Steroidobacteraceae bacterium]|nr:hypothetical protein [Steroidobacteraceae bacterium]